MSDKQWMLNSKAIRHAKECIQIVKEELDIKLTLSHPDFILLLHEYVDMLDSKALGDAYAQLIAMAGPGTLLQSLPPKNQNIIDLPVKRAVGDIAPMQSDEPPQQDPKEMIMARGKSYPRWRDGMEFKGLYRGQPTYR